jgi:DNA-binding HxlR family transcriptional regulator
MADLTTVVHETSQLEIAHAVARKVFATLSTKWGLPVVEAIGNEAVRFAELHRRVDGISHKMLTQTLRALESDALVTRRDHGEANPRVDYRLSTAGTELLATVYGMCAWSRANLDELLTERDGSTTAAVPR